MAGHFSQPHGCSCVESAEDGAELHGDGHVAFNLELAHHERHLSVLLAAGDIHEIGKLHLDGAVGGGIFIVDDGRLHLVVDADNAVVAEIELDGLFEIATGADTRCHLFGNFWQAHASFLLKKKGHLAVALS